MGNSYLLRGSLAMDTVLLHGGRFESKILPGEISRLSVAFGVDAVEERPGGTAGNIAWNAALLGDRPSVDAAVGDDDARFWELRLSRAGADASLLRRVAGRRGSRAWILTDQDNNQIAGFHQGAMAVRAGLSAEAAGRGFRWAHLAPENAGSMGLAAIDLAVLGIPYSFDPGQALPSLLSDGDLAADFFAIARGCSALFVNDYEASLAAEAAGEDFRSWASRSVPLAVRTLGARGAELLVGEQGVLVPPCAPRAVVDPTGCGDAFRAGFLKASLSGWDPLSSVRLGSVMGSFAVEAVGGQSHAPSLAEVLCRFEENYGPVPGTFR